MEIQLDNRETIVILGGTSTIAKNVAKIWLKQRPIKIILIGRNSQKLQAVFSELNNINPLSEINYAELKFDDIDAGRKLIHEIVKSNNVSKVLIAFGTLPNQLECEENSIRLKDALFINGVLPVIYADIFASKINSSLPSTIAIIGSVAGDRGRRSNFFYGSAKSMIHTYVEGARHKFKDSNLNLCIIKPGPTQTPMTESLGLRIKLADPKIVSRDIVDGIEKNKSEIYTPSKWKIIMFIIKSLPEFIFHKLNI